MNTRTLDCPIEGLNYMEHETHKGTYYSLAPDDTHKMRVRSMDSVDDDGNIEPQYLRRIVMPVPYDFEKNENGIAAEKKEVL